MVHFYHLLTDEETDRELIECMKRREVNNKFFYFGEGAQAYYEIAGSLEDRSAEMRERVEWLLPRVPQGAAVISLGCGNCEAEAKLLAARPDLKFIGVDSSRAMLELARQQLENKLQPASLSCHLVQADMLRTEFGAFLRRFCRGLGVTRRTFLLLDNTVANSQQSDIVDTLYEILDAGDELLFDVVPRKEINILTDVETILSYESPHRTSVEQRRSNIVLQHFGWQAPRDGDILIQATEERENGSIVLHFSFRPAQDLQGVFREHAIHLLEGEHIRMLSLRRFHIPTYTNFLGRYGFNVINVTTTRDYERVHAQKR